MEERQPRISVLMPSYNTGKFLEGTLGTVIKQTYKSWELIVMDGGSTDNSLETLKNYSERYPNIHIFSESDEGPYDAIHKALDKANGEFVYVLSVSDGYIDEMWFEKCMDVMDKDGEVSLVWGIPMDMIEDGEITGPSYMYSHFLKEKDSEGEKDRKLSVISRLLSRLDIRNPKEIITLFRKINLGNLRTLKNMVSGVKPPQKRNWFKYWLSTWQIYPDANMCVATKVMRECLPAHTPGTREPGDWMGFYFNFNSKGYLAYCIPIPANYGRIHGGQISEVWKRYNDQTRVDYYKKLKAFKREYHKDPKSFSFRDRNGNKITEKGT